MVYIIAFYVFRNAQQFSIERTKPLRIKILLTLRGKGSCVSVMEEMLNKKKRILILVNNEPKNATLRDSRIGTLSQMFFAGYNEQ
jgi:hypothetical protein